MTHQRHRAAAQAVLISRMLVLPLLVMVMVCGLGVKGDRHLQMVRASTVEDESFTVARHMFESVPCKKNIVHKCFYCISSGSFAGQQPEATGW